MAEVVRARRTVSIRELARAAGALLNEIELEDAVFVVGRHGRMVALLSPLPERTVVEVIGSPRDHATEAELEVRSEWLELSTVQRDAISMAASAPTGFLSLNSLCSRYDPTTVAIAANGLELGGLLEMTYGGRRITAQGRAAAEWLARDLDRPEPAHPS